MRVLGLIPARGGSKGIPRKNVRLLRGKPLLQYTTEAALSARLLARVVLSTEDQEIAELGRRLGVDVPFVRPLELALDDTPMLPVVQHALRALESTGDRVDAVCLLQPTNPTRRDGVIDACIELLQRSGADSVVTVVPIPPEHNPHWAYLEDGEGFLRISTGESEPITRRQELPRAYCRDGSVYVVKRDVVLDGNSLYGSRLIGFELDPQESVNIDAFDDWERAERLLEAEVV